MNAYSDNGVNIKQEFIKNGVAVEIVDFNIQNATQDQCNEIKEVLQQNVLVVIKNQNKAPGYFTKFVSQVGKIANYKQFNWNPVTAEECYPLTHNQKFINPDDWPDPETYPVQRVSGKKIDGKRTGIFGSGVLDWHANLNGLNRADGVALQGYEHCSDTSTTFLNNAVAYDEMPQELIDRCKGVYCEYIYSPELWASGLPEPQLKIMTGIADSREVYKMWLIQKNIADRKGIYFYTNNRCKIITKDEKLFNDLYDYLFQEKFMYTMEYEPGDIILSDQLLSLHKRDQNDPEILAKRVLHRLTFQISNAEKWISKYNEIINSTDEDAE